ncbi:MAG: HNH endonuclease [Saprospiraceae bacterium]
MVNYTKSIIIPPSLAIEKAKGKNGSYNQPDVLKQLKEDSFNKCYICEQKGPLSINIEHFKPHHQGKNIDLKFDWNNLFWSCEHCNKTKGAKVIFDNILNCTNPEHDVLNWISCKMKLFPKEQVYITAHHTGEAIANTVELLRQAYNGTTPQKQMEAENLRDQIYAELKKFHQALDLYYDDLSDEDEKQMARRIIKKSLKIQAPFTAFKYWIIKENVKLSQEFQTFLPI